MTPTQPAVKLNLDGATFSLRFDFEAVARAEEITERPLLTGLSRRDIVTPTINFVRAMLFASLLPEHATMTYASAIKLVTRQNLVTVWTSILEAWREGLAEPEPDTADPQQSQS